MWSTYPSRDWFKPKTSFAIRQISTRILRTLTLRRERLDQLLVEDAQHLRQVVAALEDVAARFDHGILTLAVAQARALLDSEQRHLARAAEDREHRHIAQEIDRVVAPFPGTDHAAVEVEDAIELGAVESHLRRGPAAGYIPRGLRAGLRTEERYGFLDHRAR